VGKLPTMGKNALTGEARVGNPLVRSRLPRPGERLIRFRRCLDGASRGSTGKMNLPLRIDPKPYQSRSRHALSKPPAPEVARGQIPPLAFQLSPLASDGQLLPRYLQR